MPLPVGQMLGLLLATSAINQAVSVIDPVSRSADSICPVSPSVCGTITTEDPSADQATLDRFQRGGSPFGAPATPSGPITRNAASSVSST